MKNLLGKKTALAVCREQVEEVEGRRHALIERLNDHRFEKGRLEVDLAGLESSRKECVDRVARGTATTSDLDSLRETIDRARGDLRNAVEVFEATQTYLLEMEADLEVKKKALKSETERFWRVVIDRLRERYGPEIEKYFSMMSVAIDSSGPASGFPVFTSLGQAFDPKPPRWDLPAGQAEFRRIKEELEIEFGFFD